MFSLFRLFEIGVESKVVFSYIFCEYYLNALFKVEI